MAHLEDEVLARRHGEHGGPLALEGEVGELVVGGGVQGVRLDQELHLGTVAPGGEHGLPGDAD